MAELVITHKGVDISVDDNNIEEGSVDSDNDIPPPPPPPPPPESHNITHNNKSSNNKTKKIIGLVILLVLICAGIGVGLGFGLQKDSNQADVNNSYNEDIVEVESDDWANDEVVENGGWTTTTTTTKAPPPGKENDGNEDEEKIMVDTVDQLPDDLIVSLLSFLSFIIALIICAMTLKAMTTQYIISIT